MVGKWADADGRMMTSGQLEPFTTLADILLNRVKQFLSYQNGMNQKISPS